MDTRIDTEKREWTPPRLEEIDGEFAEGKMFNVGEAMAGEDTFGPES